MEFETSLLHGDKTETALPFSESQSDMEINKLEKYAKKMSMMDQKYGLIKGKLHYMKELYHNAGTAENDTSFHIPELQSKQSSTRDSSPETYRSPKEVYDRYHDTKSVEKIIKQIDDEEKSITYTARSYRIQSEECFDAFEDLSHSQASFEFMKKKEDNTNMIYQNDDLWSQKFFKTLDLSNNHLTETNSNRAEKIFKVPSVRMKSSSRNKFKKSHSVATENEKLFMNKEDMSTGRVIRVKKKKMKLKSSNSKSTTASRHGPMLPESKPSRISKRRAKRTKEVQKMASERTSIYRYYEDQKVDSHREKFDEIHRKENIGDSQIELVELFANSAVKSEQSLSATSSHPKLRLSMPKSATPGEKKVTLPSKIPSSSGAQIPIKLTKMEQPTIHESVEPEINIQPDRSSPIREKDMIIEEGCKYRYENCQSVPIRSWYGEPFVPPTYLKPTIASKLKRNNRNYFTARFNYRNIPFVVGTSITRSHNLGLNIQQVLSLMKTRQPSIATDIRPALIKKIGQGVNPQHFLDNFKDISVKSKEINDGLSEDDAVSSSRKSIENKNTEQNMDLNSTRSLLLQQREEELKRENILRARTPHPANEISELRNIMTHLYNTFAEINARHEKLQEQAEKSSDKTKFQAELNQLETELLAKEQEINAAIQLYKELMARTTKHNLKIPSTSTRLTGLLRQIQSFQQELTTS